MATVGKQRGNSCRLPSKMGSRTQEVRPVGAWVQPEPQTGCHQLNAVHSAQVEEQRIQDHLREKNARLHRFQEEVRRRVQALDRAKKEEALLKSYKAVEVERNVVCQSAFAAEKSTPRKNRCSVRSDTDLSIKNTATVNTQGGIISDMTHDKMKDEQFGEHTEKVKKFSRQARRKLTSRKVVTEHYLHDDLPGGVWKTGPTLDHPASRQTDNSLCLGDGASDGESDKENAEGVEGPATVHFEQDTSPEDTRENRNKIRSVTELSGVQVDRHPTVPNIYPGVQSEEERVRTQNQRAMYRRLFMDIEREQVKENQRRRQHRKKINDIKKSKEDERRAVEEQAQRLIEPIDPVTGETEAESFERKVREGEMKERLEEQRLKQLQKNRESERFLEALKRNLREKVEKQKVDLPALCCCGATVWDTNPNTCANNCVFYRNPKAYARALQCLLASCDVI